MLRVYEIQKLLNKNNDGKVWELVVYTKELLLEPKLIGQSRVFLNISGYKNLDNLVAKDNYLLSLEASGQWITTTGSSVKDYTQSMRFSHLSINLGSQIT